MSDVNGIIRRSALIDTSGAKTPPAIQAVVQQRLGGGVYTDQSSGDSQQNVVSGQISLGMIAAFIIGAVAFYLWTHEIQGGG